MTQSQATTREASLACTFLQGTEKAIFRKLVEDIENEYTQSQEQHHSKKTETYKFLVNCK